MELREWQYMNKPAGSAASNSSSSNVSNKSFKKRFDKLIQYYGQHLPAEVDYTMIGLLTNDKLEFAEHYDDGQVVEYKISINPATEAWSLKYYVNEQLTDEHSDKGWPELLKVLRAGYIEVPATTTLEYKNLLTEWVAMNNKTNSTSSSSGYKKRFEKLIKYHIDHASSELESITHKDIKDDGFHLSEHYNDGSNEFDRTIIVSVNKYTDEFYLSIFVDGKVVYRNEYEGYEKVLEILTGSYMFLPDEGTPDYDDLLTESLNEWQLMNPPAQQAPTASSITGGYWGYWKRFNTLIYYHVRHKGRDVDKVVRTKVSKDGFHYTEHHRAGVSGYEYDVVVNIDLATDHWTFQTSIDGKPRLGGAGDGYLELLKELRKHLNLPAEGTQEYTKLLTESYSIADDFKAYENLWD